MAAALQKQGLFTTIHKHYLTEGWLKFVQENLDVIKNVAISTGISLQDQNELKAILEKVPEIKFICIDVANGYAQNFVEFMKKTRARHQDRTTMVGNVVTREMVEELIPAGADIVKVGFALDQFARPGRKLALVIRNSAPLWSALKQLMDLTDI